MIRRRTALFVAVGLLAPLALVDSPAGAIDQDLVVTPTATPAGTSISVSSASCTGADGDVSFEASVYSGTAPNQQIVAYGNAGEGSLTLTIPDWVDPDQPAVLEASCAVYGENDVDELDYTAVDIDVEPAASAPVQVRTFSRTELLAGQAVLVTGSCGAGLGGGYVQGFVGAGTDQTGNDITDSAGEGYTQAEADGTFELEIYLSNAYVSLDIETNGSDQVTGLGVSEEPMNIPAGDYTAFVYCSDDNVDSLQFLQPETLVVTGSAPTNGIELTAADTTDTVTLSGTCEQGDVIGAFEAQSTADLLGGFSSPLDAARTNRFSSARVEAASPSPVAQRIASANLVRTNGATGRALAEDGYLEFEGTPGAGGAWQVTDTTGFDQGIVIAAAFCGDPLADGYVYDPQGVEVDVIEPTTTTTTTTTTTVPTPAPANAVSGTPDYAG